MVIGESLASGDYTFLVNFTMTKVHMKWFSVSYLRQPIQVFILWNKSGVLWVLDTFLCKCRLLFEEFTFIAQLSGPSNIEGV